MAFIGPSRNLGQLVINIYDPGWTVRLIFHLCYFSKFWTMNYNIILRSISKCSNLYKIMLISRSTFLQLFLYKRYLCPYKSQENQCLHILVIILNVFRLKDFDWVLQVQLQKVSPINVIYVPSVPCVWCPFCASCSAHASHRSSRRLCSGGRSGVGISMWYTYGRWVRAVDPNRVCVI